MTLQDRSGPATYVQLREDGWRWQVGQVVPSIQLPDLTLWYLTDEDDEGHHELHGIIMMLLTSILRVWAERRAELGPVYQDVFFGWMHDHPLVRVSPDIYVLARSPRRPPVAQVCIGLPEHLPPAVAFELITDAWQQEYQDNPLKYELLGAEALVVFDPVAVGGQVQAGRVPLQVFERVDGHLTLTASGPGPCWCQRLGAAVLSVQTDQGPMLRLAHDREGQDLVPSRDELAAQHAERAEAEAARADAAEAELARLRKELERLKR